MDRPDSLVGKAVRGAYVCDKWELRVTSRCLVDDLNAMADADFEAIDGLEIIKAFVAERSERADGTRQVTPLTCGHEVWVVARGHDHRGATFHDVEDEVIWLLAYGRHRSGKPDDFFPVCKALDRDKPLLPAKVDYERMYIERDFRFTEAVRVEAPLILRAARDADGEHRCTVGGSLAVGLSVELEGDLDATALTVAFFANQLETYEQGILLLAALYQGDAWEPVPRMPSRDLEPGEVAFTVMFSSSTAI
jgi:hypothetical protein